MIKKSILLAVIVLFYSCKTATVRSSSTKKDVKAKTNVVGIIKTTKTPELKPKAEPQIVKPQEAKIESKPVILEATTRVQVTTLIVENYIERFKDIAKEEMLKYGIPASITLGQGILESGAGTGPLSMQANNHFGIKCHKEWSGESILHDDDAAGECFRKYNNPEESYKDHSLFLTTRPRYAFLFQLPKNDYKAWAKGLKAAGYATDPNYPVKLYTLIERHGLQKFDAEVLSINGETSIANYKLENTQKENIPTVAANQSYVKHVVIKGDTLYFLSKKYGVSIEKIKELNALIENSLSIGQELLIP